MNNNVNTKIVKKLLQATAKSSQTEAILLQSTEARNDKKVFGDRCFAGVLPSETPVPGDRILPKVRV